MDAPALLRAEAADYIDTLTARVNAASQALEAERAAREAAEAYGKTQHNTAKLLASEEKKHRAEVARLKAALRAAHDLAAHGYCATVMAAIDAALAQPKEPVT